MEADELMIGDWVKIARVFRNGERSNPRNMQINCIDNVKAGWMECQPIPLTEEILEANGFKKDSTTKYYYLYYAAFWVIVCGRKEYTWLEVRTTKYGGSLISEMRGISGWKYVHQLQQVLRLCGLKQVADNFEIE